MDYTVHGILQARILEWVAFPFSRGFSQPRDQTQVFHIAGGFFASWATREAQEYWSGWPIPSPGGLPDPGIEPGSPALQADSSPTELSGKPVLCIDRWKAGDRPSKMGEMERRKQIMSIHSIPWKPKLRGLALPTPTLSGRRSRLDEGKASSLPAGLL